jgi:hypothetical protein
MMALSTETKAQILNTAIQEDRTEVRLVRGRIYSTCTFLTVSSFAVTSFLLAQQRSALGKQAWLLLAVIEASFLALLWVLFIRLKADLGWARLWLEEREDMIRSLQTQADEGEVFDPFHIEPLRKKPRLTENALYWIPALATVAMVVKLVVACCALCL